MAMQATKLDWESIERDFCAGLLSNCEIGRKYGCSETAIRKRAVKYGWERDLSQKVREKVRTNLVRKPVRTPNATEKEIVEEAAEQAVTVVRLHRADIENLRRLEQKLIDEIENNPTKLYITQYQGEIVEKVVSLTAAERSAAAANLAQVQHKRIALERQAWSLDDDRPDDALQKLADRLAKALSEDDKTNEDQQQQED